jgi:hypothetical protein
MHEPRSDDEHEGLTKKIQKGFLHVIVVGFVSSWRRLLLLV